MAPEVARAFSTDVAGPASVSGVIPADVNFASSGDWDLGNPAFAISRGPTRAPSLTPGPGLVPDAHRDTDQHDRDGPGRLPFRRLLEAWSDHGGLFHHGHGADPIDLTHG